MNQDLQRELELEEEMIGAGARRFFNKIQTAISRETESEAPYAFRLASSTVFPLSEAVERFIKDQSTSRNKTVFYRVCKDLDPKVLAFITVKNVLNSITTKVPLKKVAIAIGNQIQDEIRFSVFKSKQPGFWQKTLMSLKHRSDSTPQSRRRTMAGIQKRLSKTQAELHVDVLDHADLWHVGVRLIDLLIVTTKLVEIVHETRHGKQTTFLSATNDTMQWIEKYKEHMSLLCPMYMPTVIAPRKWTTPFNGGYHHKNMRQPFLVKTYQETYLKDLYKNRDKMPLVYQTTNALQATPWKINQNIFHVLQQLWDEQIDLGVTPKWEPIELPPFPVDGDTNPISKTMWKRSARKIHRKNTENKSKRIKFLHVVSTAQKFVNEPELYFPHQMDFRGRVYPIPGTLNPQGDDVCKSLLMFARGKKANLRWLKIHAANCFGVDKVSFEDRVKWVDEHLQQIIGCSKDSLEELFWTDADKPFQFLAACFEIHGATEDPEYVTHLPISSDATCSGIQHFSAMLKDEIGGEATNLIPGLDKPNDIYQVIATATKQKVQQDADAGHPLAHAWLQFGINRKTAKRIVMTVPYGVTYFSSTEYIKEHVEERVGDIGELTDTQPRLWAPEEDYKYASYLNTHLWKSIEENLVGATKTMEFLQQIAQVFALANQSVTWTTPVGFPVLQSYFKQRETHVQTKVGDKVTLRNTLHFNTKAISTKKQKSGISANFVHSMDAAHLQLTVDLCLKRGLKDFAFVHDSFGTHSADMDVMNECLRIAFVKLYKKHDVLGDFRDHALHVLPKKFHQYVPGLSDYGNLKIDDVKESKFFFS